MEIYDQKYVPEPVSTLPEYSNLANFAHGILRWCLRNYLLLAIWAAFSFAMVHFTNSVVWLGIGPGFVCIGVLVCIMAHLFGVCVGMIGLCLPAEKRLRTVRDIFFNGCLAIGMVVVTLIYVGFHESHFGSIERHAGQERSIPVFQDQTDDNRVPRPA